MENGLRKPFGFQGQTIDVSDQAVSALNYSDLHDEEGKKINTSDLLIAAQRQSGIFLSLMMTDQPYQADPNFKHSHMTCSACVKPPLYAYGIYARINTQMLKTPHDLLVHLSAL